MTADDFAKLILVVSLAFALIGISYQVMRLIGSFADNMSDMRQIVKTFGKLTEKFNNDYDFVSDQVKMVVKSFSGFAKNVVNPITKGLSFFNRFTKSKATSNSDIEEEE